MGRSLQVTGLIINCGFCGWEISGYLKTSINEITEHTKRKGFNSHSSGPFSLSETLSRGTLFGHTPDGTICLSVSFSSELCSAPGMFQIWKVTVARKLESISLCTPVSQSELDPYDWLRLPDGFNKNAEHGWIKLYIQQSENTYFLICMFMICVKISKFPPPHTMKTPPPPNRLCVSSSKSPSKFLGWNGNLNPALSNPSPTL